MMKDFFEKLNWITILAVAVAVEMQIGSGSMSITHMFPAAWVPGIQEAMGDLGTIGALILAYGSHGREIPDMQIPKVPPVAKIGAAILLAIMIGSLWPDPASAQGPVKTPAKTATAPVTRDPQSVLKTFVVNDIQAALDDATANNDQAAIDCWTAMLPAIQSAQNPLPTKLGAFLALQKARDAVRGIDMFKAGVGPLADLKNKCAAIIVDTNTFLIRLGVLGGGAAFGF